ncbi:MAG: class I SAM-dependent methyltransferase [Candidatus Aminicenantes bacterium]|nr:class I SAM-dependent methyltransferase [Candidatus Aminicenantes bacterium]
MFFSVKLPFAEHEVRDYERRRYRGLDQRLVHRREVRILQRIMGIIDSASEKSRASSPGPYVQAGRGDSAHERPAIEKAPRAASPGDWLASPGSYPPGLSRLALDAPCGYGRFSSFLVERGYCLASADLSISMARRACNREDLSTIPMGIVCDLVRGLPFKPGVFALVLSMRLFHHLHDPEERRRVLREFSRVAGGWVVLSYYQANALHRLQRRLRRLVKKSRTRIRMISRRAFREEVNAAGLKIVRVFPLFRGIHAQHIALLEKG